MFADKIHMHTTQMRIGNDLSDQHSKQTQDKTSIGPLEIQLHPTNIK